MRLDSGGVEKARDVCGVSGVVVSTRPVGCAGSARRARSSCVVCLYLHLMMIVVH